MMARNIRWGRYARRLKRAPHNCPHNARTSHYFVSFGCNRAIFAERTVVKGALDGRAL